MRKVIKFAVIAVYTVCLLWLVLSFGEVAVKNTSDHPVYSEYNIFEMFLDN